MNPVPDPDEGEREIWKPPSGFHLSVVLIGAVNFLLFGLGVIGVTVCLALFVLLVAGVVLAYLIPLYHSVRRQRGVCPTCRRSHALRRKRRVLHRKKCSGLVVRQATAWYEIGSWSGTSSTSREERVPVIQTIYRRTTRCRFCDAKWSAEEIEEVEDFEPDEPLPSEPEDP